MLISMLSEGSGKFDQHALPIGHLPSVPTMPPRKILMPLTTDIVGHFSKTDFRC
ncbi:hypothetical protein [Mesorhizobium sp. M0991]|uniref:hypothetical protein n=1 Tax=Mesorhizobium sp. M0991 TaxID=2957043 RepID=UPI00333DA4E6